MGYLSGQQCVTQEKFQKKRWVRFGKRTHRVGVLRVVFMKSDLFSGESRPPEGCLLWFFERFVRSCGFAMPSVVLREAATILRRISGQAPRGPRRGLHYD